MSRDTIDDVLEHAGVKGMRWGVRKETKVEKADNKWARKVAKKEAVSIFNEAATRANADLPGINAKYGNKELTDPVKIDAYHKEVEDSFNRHASIVAASKGASPSGRKTMTANLDFATGIFTVNSVDIEHSEPYLLKYIAEKNENGFIVNISPLDQELTQSFLDNTIDNVLEHYGVKGMRWGVRRKRSSSSESSSNSGGKKSVKEMSDTELRATLNRMQMEKQYREMTKGPASKAEAGKKFVQGIAQDIARQTLKNVGQSYANKVAADFMATPVKGKPDWNLPAWAKTTPDVSTLDTSISAPPIRRKKK